MSFCLTFFCRWSHHHFLWIVRFRLKLIKVHHWHDFWFVITYLCSWARGYSVDILVTLFVWRVTHIRICYSHWQTPKCPDLINFLALLGPLPVLIKSSKIIFTSLRFFVVTVCNMNEFYYRFYNLINKMRLSSIITNFFCIV